MRKPVAKTTCVVAAGLLTLAATCAAQAAETKTKVPSPPVAQKPLDLKAPDIRRLFTATQVQAWANPHQPEYIEEVEVSRRRPSWIGQFARWFLPYTSPVATNTKVYRVADASTPYLKPVVALPRMAGEPVPYDR